MAVVRARIWPECRCPAIALEHRFLLTFTSVVIAMVMFVPHGTVCGRDLGRHVRCTRRDPCRRGLFARLGPASNWLHAIGIRPDPSSGSKIIEGLSRVTVLLLIALGLPNTLQILAPYEPALGVKPARRAWLVRKSRWSPSSGRAIGLAAGLGGGDFVVGPVVRIFYAGSSDGQADRFLVI